MLSSESQYRLGVVPRPAYAFGIGRAVSEAGALGYPGITVIEFGVAGGNGLLAMLAHARHLSNTTGLAIRVVGFDVGGGLPKPVDYRDRPHVWAAGDYPMHESALRSRLTGAELVIGDVRDTVAAFVAGRAGELRESPVGFVSFDLDYRSSTMAALEVFRNDGATMRCLPRVTCYFDDIPGTVEDVGEFRAIKDFNEEAHGRRIRAQYGLRSDIPFQPAWGDQIFECHVFDHHRYEQPLNAEPKRLDLANG